MNFLTRVMMSKNLKMIELKEDFLNNLISQKQKMNMFNRHQQQKLVRLILQLQNNNKKNHFDELIDNIFDSKPIFDASPKVEDIFINDDYLFDESDEQETKDIPNDIINNTDTNEVLFGDLPEPKFVVQDKSIKKMKITPNKNLERLTKK